MITTTTTLYTYGRNTDDVIAGFLGNMSAGQIVDGEPRGLDVTLLNHCTEVDPDNYSDHPADLTEREYHVAFTCAEIAARIVEMAQHAD